MSHCDAAPANAPHELRLTVRTCCPGGSTETSVSAVARAVSERFEIAAADPFPAHSARQASGRSGRRADSNCRPLVPQATQRGGGVIVGRWQEVASLLGFRKSHRMACPASPRDGPARGRTLAGRRVLPRSCRGGDVSLQLTCSDRLGDLPPPQRLPSGSSVYRRRNGGLRHLVGRATLRAGHVRPLATRPAWTRIPMEDRVRFRARLSGSRTHHRAGDLACVGQGSAVHSSSVGDAPTCRPFARALVSKRSRSGGVRDRVFRCPGRRAPNGCSLPRWSDSHRSDTSVRRLALPGRRRRRCARWPRRGAHRVLRRSLPLVADRGDDQSAYGPNSCPGLACSRRSQATSAAADLARTTGAGPARGRTLSAIERFPAMAGPRRA